MSGTWLTGWAAGDKVPAAEFRKGVGAIFDTTLGVAAASITIASIPAGYAHLAFELYGRGDAAAIGIAVNMRFNGDVGANYDDQSSGGNAATAFAGEIFAQTVIHIGDFPAASAPANLPGEIDGIVANYANATFNKTCRTNCAVKRGTTTTTMFVTQHAGFWRSNAAINSITFLATAGNFVAGTRATLYVMGA